MVHIVNLTEFNSPPNSSSTSYPQKIKNNNNKLQGSLASSDQEDKLDLGGNSHKARHDKGLYPALSVHTFQEAEVGEIKGKKGKKNMTRVN